MAIDRTPVVKRCRQLGVDPGLLGYTHKPSIRTRIFRRRPSEYALQLQEKQKLKLIYGVMERQFKRTFKAASRQKGITGEQLLQLMELRLDNVVFRLGLAKTRAQARQLCNHRHILVNGKVLDIPSAPVKSGDSISVAASRLQELKKSRFKTGRKLPSWLSFDEESTTARVLQPPQRSDIDYDIKESLIVELYSK